VATPLRRQSAYAEAMRPDPSVTVSSSAAELEKPVFFPCCLPRKSVATPLRRRSAYAEAMRRDPSVTVSSSAAELEKPVFFPCCLPRRSVATPLRQRSAYAEAMRPEPSLTCHRRRQCSKSQLSSHAVSSREARQRHYDDGLHTLRR
jgi:hypothetical protein